MRRFYAPQENFAEWSVELDAEQTRHLRDVLRLKIGDEVNVFDGMGREYACKIKSIEKKHSILSIVSEIAPSAPESKLILNFAAAITKGEKFDIVVQKAVELGAAGLQPLYTLRCEVKPSGSDRRLVRWRKIALEAAKQCGRAKLMTVSEPIDFDKFTRSVSGNVIMFSERDGESFSKTKPAGELTAMVGPAGGWGDNELEAARERGFQITTLGGRILRAETAAIAFMAILQNRFGDIN
ncbi:MAG: 16S rRNA (uracil(1498)-N(3))-methyltransferase [Acidobacteriota bacterium]